MTTTKTLIFAGIAAAFLPGMAIAQNSTIQGYLLDTRGNVVKNNGCVRKSCW